MVCGVVDLLLRGKRYLRDLKFFTSPANMQDLVSRHRPSRRRRFHDVVWLWDNICNTALGYIWGNAALGDIWANTALA